MAGGTRKGCTLSLILFILALDPLLCLLESQPAFQGITIGYKIVLLTAFAGDLLLCTVFPS